ncbi:metallophosphoesterase [Geobacter sp. SVR]|uniref:metallophosphoesterase n=1 Tax=Geobacter sp. SVR TaxID=2495594 RepID=UPI00143EF769|nr:metallophosphoesterase [Geobacter sp. SVR]BCS53587.1 serine/threonine protein phosphatase [Geobacter sp. SVR]GCF84216.1 serine/threonine protein phosphatase [Geobacter sp. SVR]
MPNRSFAIGDIHGCCLTFRKLLASIAQQGAETVYLLGDFIDRGPDTRGVITTIIRMQREGLDIKPIKGNHEDMLLSAIDSGRDEDLWNWLRNGGDRTLKSYNLDHPRDIPHEHVDFLRNLPLYYVTDTHILVHAGLDFRLDDPFSPAGHLAMLWERSRLYDRIKAGGRKLVVGHTIRDLEKIVESLGTDIIQLDNGCYLGAGYRGRGKLVALELESNRLSFQENVDMPFLLRRWYDLRTLPRRT